MKQAAFTAALENELQARRAPLDQDELLEFRRCLSTAKKGAAYRKGR
jgi:hypothetical protein